MIEFKQELEDLMSEHECLTINLIASELNIHINKGKFLNLETFESKGPKNSVMSHNLCSFI